ncbi:MAG: hypothetical protein IT435_05120 [Phycisphaerales bacterium]|nr:hypothetical protein [Phycisphaerales bacterium]
MSAFRLFQASLGWIVSAVFVAAGIFKLVDLELFGRSLETWSLLPKWLIRPLMVAVPSLEIGVALMWLLGAYRTLAVAAMVAMLVAATGFYGLHLAFGIQPVCACFGAVHKALELKQVAGTVLARNICLILALAYQYVLHCTGGPNLHQSATHEPFKARRAFTIVEMLVVIAVIIIVASLLTPMLRQSRTAGKDVASLANLRSHSANVASYTSEFRGVFPYFTNPRGIVLIPHDSGEFPAIYFDMYFVWSLGMSHLYYDGKMPHVSHYRPGSPSICTYFYSATLVSQPEFWNALTRTGPEQWRAVGIDSVVFPSQKAAFTECDGIVMTPPNAIGKGVLLGLIDGSAQLSPASTLMEPYRKGEGGWEGSRFSGGVYGMHTIDGVRGRDIR